MTQFALVNLARQIGDRFRDIDDVLRQPRADVARSTERGEHARELVDQGGQLDAEEQGRVFGESLPKGLRSALISQLVEAAGKTPAAPADRAGRSTAICRWQRAECTSRIRSRTSAPRP